MGLGAFFNRLATKGRFCYIWRVKNKVQSLR